MWVLIGLGTILWLVCGFIGSWMFYKTYMEKKGYMSISDAFILSFLTLFGVVGLGITYLETHGDDVFMRIKK